MLEILFFSYFLSDGSHFSNLIISAKQPIQYVSLFYTFRFSYIILVSAGTLCGLLEVSVVGRFRYTVHIYVL